MKERIYTFFRRLRLRFFPPKSLLTVDEHFKLIEKSRRLECIQEDVCKSLKCGPEETHLKINKVLTHIDELEAILRKAHVGKLIDLTHKNCKKHGGPDCQQCQKCLDNQCEKCASVDWLRINLGLEPLLNKNKH